MYKVIIHMGLSKTATTSLQNNFFLKLHQRGKINFLGKASRVSEGEVFNPFGPIMSELRRERLDADKELELRRKFHSMLCYKKVNLISEESLTVTSDQKHELLYENLKLLTDGCQVQVLICLRNPVDFFYSAYIEMHRWTYYRIKSKDTASKFLAALCSEPSSSEYDMFFFVRLLEKIKKRFPNIDVYLFEDFKGSKSKLLEILSDLFELPVGEMQFIDGIGSENMRKSSEDSKIGEAVTLNQRIVFVINRVFTRNARQRFKRLAFIRMAYHRILAIASKINVKPTPVHPNLTEEQVKKLSETLGLNKDYLVESYGLDAADLKKYKY